MKIIIIIGCISAFLTLILLLAGTGMNIREARKHEQKGS